MCNYWKLGDRVAADNGDSGLVTDGIAAGGSWDKVSLDVGPHAGRDIWLCEKEYLAAQGDDGFLFNTEESQDEGTTGTYLPELQGTKFFIID
jgi:hypothetical protein